MPTMNEPLQSGSFEVSPQEVIAELDNGKKLKLIDCRSAEEYAIAHVAHSIHIPLHDLSSQLEQLYQFEDEALVVLCHHGVRSQQAAAILRDVGFPDVRSMTGGIDRWSREIDATVQRY